MSFRGRLRLFFMSIVIVPMIAVALVLFTLTAESETGKADARMATGLQNAFVLYREAVRRAQPALRRVASDGDLTGALAAGDLEAARKRMAGLVRANPGLVSIDFYPSEGSVLHAGRRDGVAAASTRITVRGRGPIGALSVSVTRAGRLARSVARLSDLEVSIFEGGRRLATTERGLRGAPEQAPPDRSIEFEVGGSSYRGRVNRIRPAAGPPVDIVVFREADDVAEAIAANRILVGAILASFLLLALATSVFVVRALQGQIGQFLDAARRLARGEFKEQVPTEGNDEFAALGREFNSMSKQLEAKIEEVERKKLELEETIRRVGAAFASGLDRQGVVELAVETAVLACEANAGRALPVEAGMFREARTGHVEDSLDSALEAAEREAFRVRPELGPELLDSGEAAVAAPPQRGAIAASADGACALAVPMRARLGAGSSAQYVGVISIARHGQAFKREEEEILEYLAGQAVVSIENADLHETVQRQAVTDELTGLSNVRELQTVLDREVERSRRFDSPLGLVMLDIDNFKRVNDDYGHQQGDEVLAAVARVVRQHSRDIDEPARYGGEELAVVLPETDGEGAAQVAERMREAIERMRVPTVGGDGYLTVTASFGVASIPGSAMDKESMVAAADGALYRAKRAGKNRVERADAVAVPR